MASRIQAFKTVNSNEYHFSNTEYYCTLQVVVPQTQRTHPCIDGSLEVRLESSLEPVKPRTLRESSAWNRSALDVRSMGNVTRNVVLSYQLGNDYLTATLFNGTTYQWETRESDLYRTDRSQCLHSITQRGLYIGGRDTGGSSPIDSIERNNHQLLG